ncbi:MAG: peptide chain release factor N(5)-glutamine methyltransferase [Thermonemataceae bacterium]|nr:peptide chain release factor N(5)-glutamine methyltransferase [Thermonemataceae bacterium]
MILTSKTIQKEIAQELLTYYTSSEAEQLSFILLEYFFSVQKTVILKNINFHIDSSLKKKLFDAINRLKKQEPIQYILGEAYFLGRKFMVNENVLIPRPETEELVGLICQKHQQKKMAILDIGTGSACIAVSLALCMPKAMVSALDISEKALEVAKKNAQNFEVSINFIKADVLEWQADKQSYDIVVSNPPYITESEKIFMEKNVLDFEPSLALFVKDDKPLIFYERIALLSTQLLSENGFLYFEINEAFGEAVKVLLQTLHFENISLKNDMYGKARFIEAQYKSSKFISK